MADLSDWQPDVGADERTTLEQFLDFYRQTIVTTVEDLADDQAAARVLPATDLTVAGIVKHLAMVEDLWFQRRLLGHDMPEPWASAPFDEDRDWAFHSAEHDTVAEVLELYRISCERSRATLASQDSLDAKAAGRPSRQGPVSLRWIVVHMIEETARHAGHIDLLRDAIEGRAPEG
ncbi:MAG TPA: DinB family protein [Nitriliruptorales bacterium]